MSAIKPTVKSEIIAIAYSAAVKQIIKISKSNEQINGKLFKLGEQIGLRISDEFQERQTNSYKPEETTSVFLKGIIREYLGCEVAISDKDIKYLKNKFAISFKVTIKENPLSDFVILGKAQKDEQGNTLNYHSIILGFASGSLKSMSYNPTVTLLSDSLISESESSLVNKGETVFNVDMWKQKQQD